MEPKERIAELEQHLARVTAERDELRKACEPFTKEAQFIIECQLPDAHQVGKIPVKEWRGLLAAVEPVQAQSVICETCQPHENCSHDCAHCDEIHRLGADCVHCGERDKSVGCGCALCKRQLQGKGGKHGE